MLLPINMLLTLKSALQEWPEPHQRLWQDGA